uniref:hypothetical protein n=1 Tax=Cupriavidus gilardii TaxID=82541 RepID=UPI0024788FFE|nr:hypothetical protein [Cupriavidus gilardii]WDE72549.1 hypothetical protein [Cupriavidus gilardii]
MKRSVKEFTRDLMLALMWTVPFLLVTLIRADFVSAPRWSAMYIGSSFVLGLSLACYVHGASFGFDRQRQRTSGEASSS